LLIGIGTSGGYILNKLSLKYRIEAFESGADRRFDGFTYNLSAAAPLVHDPRNRVAARKENYPQPPIGNTQWTGVINQLPYSITVPFQPVPVIPQARLGNATMGVMLGGSGEHVQGLFVNPSKLRYCRWANILKDERFLEENLLPLLTEEEKFRAHTDTTDQTWDATVYQPLEGPSKLGSFPIKRGCQGVLHASQTAPSEFAKSLSRAIYNYFREDLEYETFKLEPIVSDRCSETFNSGVNICVTEAIEYFLDPYRNRSSVARGYLNESVMIPTNQGVPSIYPDIPNTPTYPPHTVNFGPYKGINNHNFTLNLGTMVQRIVFETNPGYPSGEDYWLHKYPKTSIYPCAFVQPLKAIGIQYSSCTGTTGQPIGLTFVPGTDVICSLGAMATPILLMQSGIGPKSLLESLGIPVLHDQPNIGQHYSNHIGSIISWSGAVDVWGTTEIGVDPSHGYLPGPSNRCARKFQYFSSLALTLIDPTRVSMSMNLYDLDIKSTGWVQAEQAIDSDCGILNFKVYPNYYSDPNGEDIYNLCWIVRRVVEAILNADSTAIFTVPSNINVSDDVLFAELMTTFTQQAHYVGTCGMGPDPEVHSVNNKFILRGTSNVRVCDASSTPLEIDDNGVVYPVQNDGNTTRGLNAFGIVFVNQLLGCHD
jgi:choline dehydrogenase-like flavoprotein